MDSTQKAFSFFYEHAAFSYWPEHQTPEQGRALTALSLMEAERWARASGYIFNWEVDDVDSNEWNDEDEPYPQYLCTMINSADSVVQSLGACDFSPYGEPDAYQPHRRVIEAELAAEQKRELGE